MQTDKEMPMLEKPEYGWLVLLRAEWEFADFFNRILDSGSPVPQDKWLQDIKYNKSLLHLVKTKSPIEIAVYMYASMHQSIKASPGDVVSRSLMREKIDALTQTILFIHTSKDLSDILTERLSEIPHTTEATFVKKVRKFALDFEEQTGVNGKALLKQLMRVKYTIKKVMDNRYSSSGSLEAQFSDAQMSLDLKLPYGSIEEAVHTGFLDEMRGAFGHARSLLDAVIEECRQYHVLEEIKDTVSLPSSELIKRLTMLAKEENLIRPTDQYDSFTIPYLQKFIAINSNSIELAAQHILFLLIKRISFIVYELRVSFEEENPHDKEVDFRDIPNIDDALRAVISDEVEREIKGQTGFLELAGEVMLLENAIGMGISAEIKQPFVTMSSIDDTVDDNQIQTIWVRLNLSRRNLSSVRQRIQSKSRQLHRSLNQSEIEEIIVLESQRRL